MANNILHRVEIERLRMPVDGYHWNAKVLTSIDDGKTWWYTGLGKFCKMKLEALAYKAMISKACGQVA